MNRALRWKLIVGFVLVFVAGGMTGAFFGASHARHLFFAPPHRGMMSEKMRDRFRAQLNLTPEQVAKISPILDKAAAQLECKRSKPGTGAGTIKLGNRANPRRRSRKLLRNRIGRPDCRSYNMVSAISRRSDGPR